MSQEQLNYRKPPQLAIAEGATTPNPGAAGASAWSTTLSKPVVWTGSIWTAYQTGGAIVDVTGTTYTFAAADHGNTKRFTNGAAIAATLPQDLPVGWFCGWVQVGTGVVTFGVSGSATRNNRGGYTKSAGQYAAGSIFVDLNSGGAAAHYVLAGDTAA